MFPHSCRIIIPSHAVLPLQRPNTEYSFYCKVFSIKEVFNYSISELHLRICFILLVVLGFKIRFFFLLYVYELFEFKKKANSAAAPQ